ncbi:MAG: tetratricopeptide repeat protein [Candidatus Eisenbacteria bacterium]|nr:tetratricopeptide repeat protein [Candidatus Eisenbacteria bacterium]
MRHALPALAAVVLLATLLSGDIVAREPRRPDRVASELAVARHALVMGDVDEAVRLSEELYRRYPDEDRVFWALAKTYQAADLQRERLVPLLKARLEQRPDDDRVMMELGETYARLAEFDRAHEIWLERARKGRADVVRYSEVGALEVRYRMYERAVEIYLEGRRVSGTQTFFSEELAQLYTLLGEHEKALDECFTTAREHPGMDQWAANRVEQMLDDGADERLVRRRVDAVMSSETATPGELSLAGSVSLALGSYDDALRAFELADARAGAEGRMLMEFAEILNDEGLPGRARDAYRLVVERYEGTVNAAVSGIYAARLLVDVGRPDEAAAELEELTTTTPEHPIRGEALLEKAEIQLESLDDPTGALATLDRIPDGARFRQRSVRDRVDLLRIDALLALGRLEDAAGTAAAILGGKPRDETRHRARYYLGYVAFLDLDIEGSLERLRELVEEDPAGVLVNDALRLMLVLSDAQETGDVVPVRRLAEAHAALLSGDLAEAESRLETLVESAGLEPVASEALMLLGRVHEMSGDYDAALETYAEATGEGRTLATRAEAHMRRGAILTGELGRPGEALAEYAMLIEQLPSNFLTGEARRRAEAIRREEGL